MAKRTFKAGATSQTFDVFIRDSSSTIGAGLSGLVFNTANLKAYYRKGATGSATAVTLATQTVGGAWSSGGFVEIDATNMKGVYRFDCPDTVLASSPWATLYFYGATNMAPVVVELEIVAVDPFNATTFGLTNLDATVSSRLASASYVAPTNLTAAQIATGIWQDTTAGDFTTAASIGKSIMNGVALGTGLTVNQLTTNNDKTGYTLTSGERTAIADAMLDEANGVETSWTVRQFYRISFAALAGKADGGSTVTMHFRDQADTKNRITATVDANGNRTAVTLDAS